MLSPGMVFVDAGANVGEYTMKGALRVGGEGEVHAFEPVPSSYASLVRNVTSNNLLAPIRLNMMALWNQRGVVELRLASTKEGNSGAYTIGNCATVVDSISSPAIRLDDYVASSRVNRVDFLKVDVEGAELFVLQGSKETLSRWRPTMLLEINRVACQGLLYQPEEIWDFLRPFGYRIWAVGGGPDKCRPLKDLSNVNYENVFFHINDLPPQVLSGWSHRSALMSHLRIASPVD
jgi:FkbM family methyltransferase